MLVFRWQIHPAWDVTRVSVVPRNVTEVTVKIGDAENRWRGCRDKNRLKRTKIPVRLVLSRVPFKSGVWNYAYKMLKYFISLLVKPKLKKNLLSVLLYRLPRFIGKGQNQHIATFWRHKSIEIDRLTYKLASLRRFVVHSEARTRLDNLTRCSLQMHGFLHEMRKCCIFHCAENRWRDAENWNRVWVWYGLLFWHTFGNVCCFYSDLPSTHCTTCWKWSSYKHSVCLSVRPSVRSSVVSLRM